MNNKELSEWIERNRNEPWFHAIYSAPRPGRREDVKCLLKEMTEDEF